MKRIFTFSVFIFVLTLFFSCSTKKDEENDSDSAMNDSDSIQLDDDNTSVSDDDQVVDTTCDSGCLVDDICYPDGVADPTNSCLKCDASSSKTEWSNNNGAICDDGLFCTENDKCSTGECSGVEISPNDGVECNGVESCDESGDKVDTTGNQCGDLQVCDIATGKCVETCPDGCAIDSVCYGNGQINPMNDCEKCDTKTNASSWSSVEDGTVCNDGKFCSENDVCGSGTCSGTVVNPDDTIACNGSETCNEETDAVETTGNQCQETQFCDYSTDSCIDTCPGCLIDSICYGDGQFNSLNSCEKCDRVTSKNSWTARGDGLECNDGKFCTEHDKCSSGACEGADVNPDDGIVCNGLETCDEIEDEIVSTLDPKDECKDNQVCDYNSGSCIDVCPGCIIDNVCYGDGQVNPSDACKVCTTSSSLTEWNEGNGYDSDDECQCNDGWEGNLCMDERCAIRVKTDGDDSFDGTTWTDAMLTVQAAMDRALTPGCDVWIKEGTYNEKIELKNGVRIYGSFKGTETIFDDRSVPEETVADRTVPAPTTIFSGEDSGTVVICSLDSGCGDSAKLNGITFSGGNSEKGGGLYVYKANPLISNCLFTGNTASMGGGVYIDNASPVFYGCRFTANTTNGDTDGGNGGGIYSLSSSPEIISTVIDENTTGNGVDAGNGGNGAGMYNNQSSPKIFNSMVSENTTGNGGDSGKGGDGGGVYNYNSSFTLINSIVRGNSTGSGTTGGNGAGMFNTGSSPVLTNCLMIANTLAENGNGSWMYSVSSSMITAKNSIFRSGSFYTNASTISVTYSDVEGGFSGAENISDDPLFLNESAGDYRLQDISPCVDGGNNDLLNTDFLDADFDNDMLEKTPLDMDGKSRIRYTTVDMGPYENESIPPQIFSVTPISATQIEVLFDDFIDETTSEVVENYVVNNDIEVLSAEYNLGSGRLVLLTVSDMNLHDDYTITIDNVLDERGDMIAIGSTADFSVAFLRPQPQTVIPIKATEIEVMFDENMDETSAQTVENYSLNNGITVTAAVLSSTDKKLVTLTVDDLNSNDEYVVSLKRIKDATGMLSVEEKDFNITIEPLRPIMVAAEMTSETTVEVFFDRSMDDTTAVDSAHYALTDLTVNDAAHTASLHRITLTTDSAMSTGTIYTATATDVRSSEGFVIKSPVSADFKSFGEGSCKAILDAGLSEGDGTYTVAKESGFVTHYCDMTTDGGGWTMVLRFNSNDETTRHWADTAFWNSDTEQGDLYDSNDYLSQSYNDVTDFTQVLFSYDYAESGSKNMSSAYDYKNTSSFRVNANRGLSNSNTEWTRFFEGSPEAQEWYGPAMRFQTTGNGNDYFRIWYNRTAVNACNQAGGIGLRGDSGGWYNELSYPSETAGCQENLIRGTLGTNGSGNLQVEDLLTPEDVYENGMMYVFVRNNPVILNVNIVSSTEIEVVFNNEMDQTTAEIASNYEVDNGISVTNAVLDSVEGKIVTLTVSDLDGNNDYVLTANGIEDITGAEILPDRTESFSVATMRPTVDDHTIMAINKLRIHYSKDVVTAQTETAGNYQLEDYDDVNISVHGVSLQADQQTADMNISNLRPPWGHRLYINNIKSIDGFSLPSGYVYNFQANATPRCDDGVSTEDGYQTIRLNLNVGARTADFIRVYCDMTTAMGEWNMVLRLNSNDAHTRHYADTGFWSTTSEIGDLEGTGDYVSPIFYEADFMSTSYGVWDAIMFDYRYHYDGQPEKRVVAIYHYDANDQLLRNLVNQPLNNSNTSWERWRGEGTGDDVTDLDPDNWFGEVLKFQTNGNGNDPIRLWYNKVAVDACNQAGGIGSYGDNGVWYHELSYPSTTAGCQENLIRGRIGANGGGSLMTETELAPDEMYHNGVMRVYLHR